ncbi:glycosyltransferase family 9 protein [soil metagenome]
MTERIAVVRALQLGDLLVAVPALRALRSRFSKAEITLIGLPWAEWFAGRFSEYIDQFLPFPGWPEIDEAGYDPRQTEGFIQAQRAYGYDLVIQMHGNGRTMNGFALALGGRTTAGYFTGERPAGLSPAAPYPDDRPEILRNLGLAQLVGATDLRTNLEFPLYDADRDKARSLLPPRGLESIPRVGIHAGASAPSRRWPAERFADVARDLVTRHGAQLVLTGGPGEEEIAETVAMLVNVPVTNLAGQTSLGGLAAVLSELDLFVTNDTGPGHIATALGVPSVTIFGPADFRRWAPLDTSRHAVVRRQVECSPCPHRICPIDHRCLSWIESPEVIAAADGLLTGVHVV